MGAPTTKVLLATAAPPPSDCQGPDAGDMAQMLLMSRQDYARWHSYELHVSTVVSPAVRVPLTRICSKPLQGSWGPALVLQAQSL